MTPPVLASPSTPVELRRRAAALGGGGRAGRDGDAVDMSRHFTSPRRYSIDAPHLNLNSTVAVSLQLSGN